MNPLTGKVSSMIEMIDWLRKAPEIMSQVTYWHTIPSRDPKLAEFSRRFACGYSCCTRA